MTDFHVADVVTYQPHADVEALDALESHYGPSRWVGFGTDYPAVVMKVNKTTVHISFYPNDNDTINAPCAARYSVPMSTIRPTGTKLRMLGDVPEGGLSPLDPRLSWLWEDANRLAEQRSHCREYRDMCDTLGIPGPVREFKITRDISGLSMTFPVQARSVAESEIVANELLSEKNLV